jgi:hypothetical protein
MSQLNILGNLCEMYGNCVCQICVNIDLKLNCLIQCSVDSHIYLLVPDKLNYNIMFNLVYKVVNFGFVCFQFCERILLKIQRAVSMYPYYAVFTITNNQRTTLLMMCNTINTLIVYEFPDMSSCVNVINATTICLIC